jgi:hypothetical protein
MLVYIVVIHAASRQLLHMIHALAAAGRLARRLNSRQQQRYQNANNGNDDQQLDECEGSSLKIARGPGRRSHRTYLLSDAERAIIRFVERNANEQYCNNGRSRPRQRRPGWLWAHLREGFQSLCVADSRRFCQSPSFSYEYGT